MFSLISVSVVKIWTRSVLALTPKRMSRSTRTLSVRAFILSIAPVQPKNLELVVQSINRSINQSIRWPERLQIDISFQRAILLPTPPGDEIVETTRFNPERPLVVTSLAWHFGGSRCSKVVIYYHWSHGWADHHAETICPFVPRCVRWGLGS